MFYEEEKDYVGMLEDVVDIVDIVEESYFYKEKNIVLIMFGMILDMLKM